MWEGGLKVRWAAEGNGTVGDRKHMVAIQRLHSFSL
jgi:hypothetical protein